MNNHSRIALDTLETPFYLIDEQELNKNVTNIKNALNKYWNNYTIGYSVKTNSLPWLLEYFLEKGIFAEVVSDDEYDLARMIGYENNNIIYNGLAKSKKTFLEAIQNGSIVNIDSYRELQWLKELNPSSGKIYGVGIRVNFDLESYCPNESLMASDEGRFGFCFENRELKKAIDYIKHLNNVKLSGLHLHCSTRTRSLNVFKAISKVACEIKRAYGLDLNYVDIGGGFYGGLKDKPQFDDYLKVISEELSKEFNKSKVTLILEPGTAIVSSPFSFISSVIDVKETLSNFFVTTDGSNFNINPLQKKSKIFFDIKYKDERARQILDKQIITGYTCMDGDRLLELEGCPQLSVGDQIIFEKIGAYSMCFSPLFIKYFPNVYVIKCGEIFKVREKWTAKDYLK